MIRILLFRIRLGATAVPLAVVAACAASVVAIAAQTANKDGSISPESRALVRQAIASTGLISVRDSSNQQLRPRGSAVVVRSDGVLVTNYHVITNTKTGRSYDEIYVGLSGDADTPFSSARYRLKPLLINKEYDLALLRIESDADGNPTTKSFTFPSVEIGDSRKIKFLDDLFIIGFPEKGGASITINHGVVEGRDILANWIKTDARVIHGNSGGAAVDSEGRLIGIPTKVVADEQPIDRDGDGFPDDSRRYGAVGFLRPSQLVADMIAQLRDDGSENRGIPSSPKMADSSTLITVRGIVKSAASGRPVAGALVGLLPIGETSVTESTLLTWGSTNGEGAFRLNKPVPPGKYTLKAKALSSQPYSAEVEVTTAGSALIIEMRSAPDR